MDSTSSRLSLRWWWYFFPGYLTLWSLAFGTWNFVDAPAMFAAFQIDVSTETVHDLFILQNSAARYLGIAVALVLGVLVLRTRASILTALAARSTMDVLDLVAGLRTGVIENPGTGILQSALMFLVPSLLAGVLLGRAQRDGATSPC